MADLQKKKKEEKEEARRKFTLDFWIQDQIITTKRDASMFKRN